MAGMIGVDRDPFPRLLASDRPAEAPEVRADRRRVDVALYGLWAIERPSRGRDGMNHDLAADVRTTLNEKQYVEGPDDDKGDEILYLVRVRQPGYLNGEPMYETLVDIRNPDRLHLPHDFLQLVTDHGCYLQISDGTIHIRDWRTDGDIDE